MPDLNVLSDHFKIFKSDYDGGSTSDICLISAHGGGGRAGRQFTVRGNATIVFMVPEGQGVRVPSVNPANVAFYMEGFQRLRDGDQAGYQVVRPGELCPDYDLQKFQGRHNPGNHETYADIDDAITEVAIPVVLHLAKRNFADVVTVRNRRSLTTRWHTPTLSEIVNLLALKPAYDYRYILCSFCRSRSEGGCCVG